MEQGKIKKNCKIERLISAIFYILHINKEKNENRN